MSEKQHIKNNNNKYNNNSNNPLTARCTEGVKKPIGMNKISQSIPCLRDHINECFNQTKLEREAIQPKLTLSLVCTSLGRTLATDRCCGQLFFSQQTMANIHSFIVQATWLAEVHGWRDQMKILYSFVSPLSFWFSLCRWKKVQFNVPYTIDVLMHAPCQLGMLWWKNVSSLSHTYA